LVVITGLSGSGKSLAAKCFEDLGYFCVDNLPVGLIPPFRDLIEKSAARIPRAALVIDVRGGDLAALPETLRELQRHGAPVRLLFFEASDDVLKRRFSETRRPHPVAGPRGVLEDGIRREREALAPLREIADRIIDTARFNAHELRQFLQGAFGTGEETSGGLNINIESFGFKYGIPAEADLVFDVRFLPNPYFVENLRPLNGKDAEVRAFLDAQKEKAPFMNHLTTMLDFLVPLYAAEGKSYLTVALGCTGGKHRSVALAEELGKHLGGRGGTTSVSHRDLGRE
ncbi:MAG: RNase adapter RapZ, partial [Acidobacteriota bacterium]|nr:RNase adapter RapZ [Acidobacteriota bacterium]